MTKVMIAATTLAAMTVAPFAFAQSTPAAPTTTTTTTSSTAAQAPAGQPIQLTQTPTPTTGAAVGTTTLTSSDDATAMPPPSVESTTRQNETITLKQTFHPNRPLLYTGAALFVGSYATTAALTASKQGNGENGDKTMYLPVVGPWLHLADNKETGKDLALDIGSGILQGVGVGMALVSIFVPEHVPAATIQAGNVKMNIGPGAAYGTF